MDAREPQTPGETLVPTGRRPVWGERPFVRFLLRTTSMVVLLTTAYYVWPAQPPTEDVGAAVRLGGALLAIGLVVVVGRAQIIALRQGRSPRTDVEALLTALYLLVIVFAVVYGRIATVPGQFVGLETKTDALYFTVTVISTVGFGDIHAEGTAARAVVTAQMLFSLMYIGSAVRVLGSSWSGSVRSSSAPLG